MTQAGDEGGPVQLTRDETLRRLPYARLVPQIRRAAADLRGGRLRAPQRLVLPMTGGSLMCMPASADDLAMVKLITVMPDNGTCGQPVVQGQVTIFGPIDGRPLARLDAEAVTERRTAAVSLAGVERLGATPRRVLIVGGGVQAAAHLDAFAEHFGTHDFIVATRRPASAERLRARALARRPGLAIIPVAIADIARWLDVDVIVCATTATAPVLPAEVPPRALIVAVGAYRPDMVEVPPALVRRRAIIVDDRDGARHEAGDLIAAGVDWQKVRELGDDGEVGEHAGGWLLKTVGHAAWDLAACRTMLEAEG